MKTAHFQASTPCPDIHDFVSSDFHALAAHMSTCRRSRGRFFHLRAALDSFHVLASTRVVTTAVLFAVCGLGLMAFA